MVLPTVFPVDVCAPVIHASRERPPFQKSLISFDLHAFAARLPPCSGGRVLKHFADRLLLNVCLSDGSRGSKWTRFIFVSIQTLYIVINSKK